MIYFHLIKLVVFNNKNIMSNINRKFLFKWIPLIQAERMIENIISFKVNPIYFIDIICLIFSLDKNNDAGFIIIAGLTLIKQTPNEYNNQKSKYQITYSKITCNLFSELLEKINHNLISNNSCRNYQRQYRYQHIFY